MKPELKDNAGYNRAEGAQWFGFAIEFGGVLAIFTFGGYKLDQVLDTQPWLMLAGFFLALVGLIYRTIKAALGWDKRRDSDKPPS